MEMMHTPIWILQSLFRQVETGSAITEGPYEPIVQLLKIAIGAFSLLLLALAISAYRKTALRGLIYAAVAFGLFAVQLFFDFLEDSVESLQQPFNDVIFYALTLGVLVFFFLAVVRGRDQKA